MRVRRLDKQHDWTFGAGRSSYERDSLAIAQCVKTRLLSLHRDWFLNPDFGVKWVNYLGKNPNWRAMEAELKNTVLRTDGVVELTGFDLAFDSTTRVCTVSVRYSDRYKTNNEVVINGPNHR